MLFGAGKGGVGTSTCAALTALAAARAGREVLLVEADDQSGSLGLLFGLGGLRAGLSDLRAGADPEDLLVPVAPGLRLLPGGGGSVDATWASAAGERRALLRRVASLYDGYDLVVVDGGSRVDGVMAAAAPGVATLLVVTGPDRIALAGAHALLKVMAARLPGVPAELVVAGTDEAGGREAHRVSSEAAALFLERELPFAGAVPTDDAVAAAVAEGRSIAELGAPSRALGAAEGLAARLGAVTLLGTA